jgi:hypothetical protein
MTIKYKIRFEFDLEGEPPKQHIWEEQDSEEVHIAEVDENPISKLGGKLIEISPGIVEWKGPWSWDDDDWQSGPIANGIIDALNFKRIII